MAASESVSGAGATESGSHVDVGGLKLWVLAAGPGDGATAAGRAGPLPTLLLIHGLAAGSETWLPVFNPLAQSCRVIAPDLPGCRRSDKPHTGYDVESLVGRLLGLIDALGVERAHLVGHSFGGHIALALALAHPDRVQSLVLVGAGGLGQEVDRRGLEPLLEEINEANVRGFLAAVLHRPERASNTMVQTLVRELRDPAARSALYVMARASAGPAGQRHVLTDRLGELQPRTLVIWGEHDAVFPVHQGRAAAALMPRGRFVAIPDAGHCPHLEQPEAFVAAVNSWLGFSPRA